MASRSLSLALFLSFYAGWISMSSAEFLEVVAVDTIRNRGETIVASQLSSRSGSSKIPALFP
jgi:hypothetical protein